MKTNKEIMAKINESLRKMDKETKKKNWNKSFKYLGMAEALAWVL